VNNMVLLTRKTAFIIFSREKSLRGEMSFREFLNTHKESGVTLRTGAKLYKSHTNGYFISGHHWQGEDVLPYRKFDRRAV
jgi:hypothetical protein